MMGIDIVIKSKQQIVFSGNVSHVFSKNSRGDFSILPMHANFITLIQDFVILDKGLPTERKFDVTKGLLRVLDNAVEVYIGL